MPKQQQFLRHTVNQEGKPYQFKSKEFIKMSESEDKNALVYLLAGFGLGCIVGAAAGVLFAPAKGADTRENLGSKFKEIKGKTSEWVSEQRAKRQAMAAAEEVGA